MARPCPVRLYTIYDMAFLYKYIPLSVLNLTLVGCARFISCGVALAVFWLSWTFGAARCGMRCTPGARLYRPCVSLYLSVCLSLKRAL